jgi:hypothetical protein
MIRSQRPSKPADLRNQPFENKAMRYNLLVDLRKEKEHEPEFNGSEIKDHGIEDLSPYV